MIRERAIEECTSMSEAYDEGYEQGVADSNGEMTWVETNVIKEANQILGEVNSIYQRGYSDGYQQGRADAIEEYMNKLCDKCIQSPNECYNLECPFADDECQIIKIAEQLKEK